MDSFFIKPGTAHSLQSNKGSKHAVDSRVYSKPSSSRGGGRGGRGGRGAMGRGGSGSSRGRGGAMSRGRGGSGPNRGRGGRVNSDGNNKYSKQSKQQDDYYSDNEEGEEEEKEQEDQEQDIDNSDDNDNSNDIEQDDDDSEEPQQEDDDDDSDQDSNSNSKKRKFKLSVLEEEETADEKRIRLAKEYLSQFSKFKDANEIGDAIKEDMDRQSGRYQHSYKKSISELKITKDNITYLKGHNSPVTCVVLSDDQRYAFSASRDVIIKWDLIKKVKVMKLNGFIPSKKNREIRQGLSKQERMDAAKHTFEGKILAMALSFDGKYLVTGGQEKRIKVWNADTFEIIEEFKGHQDIVSALTFRKGTYTLYSGSHDRTVKIWDLSQMAFVDTRYGHQSPITAIDALSRERCVTVSTDQTCRIWKIPEESQLIFRGPKSSVDCVTLLAEDKFVSGSQDGSLQMWNVQKKNAVFTKADAHPAAVDPTSISEQGINNSCLNWITSIATIKNSDILASGACDGKVRLWGILGEKLKEINSVDIKGFVNDMVFASDASFLLVASSQEHKFGRWKRLKEGKNCLIFINLSNNSNDNNSNDNSQDEQDDDENMIQDQDEEDDDEEEQDDE
ncbi:hypothetical protein CYY_005684 [Polysphondylium violaceum]|uniref:WD40 repeat-containing protein n=1 Tax=Polysphondylium violaceum TaxID=133409 RepID=A0A8J4US07_9MYCE|nr:hypothetical protein CYY_005684 [Polysphondylium violaceum]